MEQNKYPTANPHKYAYEELLKSLATYEQAKEAYNNGFKTFVQHYWFDNTPWNGQEPIGLMSKEDAEYVEPKGSCFLDFDTTIPAITKADYELWKS